MRRTLLLTAIALAALALGGCGRDGARADVRAVTDRFLAAIDQRDGAAACAQLSHDTVTQLETQEKGSCDSVVTELGLRRAPVRSIELYVTSAKVDLANGSSWFLDETSAGWRLSALACRPTQGDPTTVPMSCEVEA